MSPESTPVSPGERLSAIPPDQAKKAEDSEKLETINKKIEEKLPISEDFRLVARPNPFRENKPNYVLDGDRDNQYEGVYETAHIEPGEQGSGYELVTSSGRRYAITLVDGGFDGKVVFLLVKKVLVKKVLDSEAQPQRLGPNEYFYTDVLSSDKNQRLPDDIVDRYIADTKW